MQTNYLSNSGSLETSIPEKAPRPSVSSEYRKLLFIGTFYYTLVGMHGAHEKITCTARTFGFRFSVKLPQKEEQEPRMELHKFEASHVLGGRKVEIPGVTQPKR